MAKIGIVTAWWCYENYGQILQCYALQRCLIKKGHEPFLIKYIPSYKDRNIWNFIKSPNRLISAFIRCLKRNRLQEKLVNKRALEKKILRDFDGFRSEYIIGTPEIYYSYNQLDKSEINADVFIVGSDQIWRYFPLNDDGLPFFLNFGNVDAIRISYAPSFGSAEISKKYYDFILPLMKKLDGVSVREKSGIKICSSLGRPDAKCVLDPTLLLDSSDYLRFVSEELQLKYQNESYIFLYFLRADINVPWNEINSLANQSNCKIKSTEVYNANLPFDEFSNPTIPEWISILSNSKYVFTNSFHGTVFSILMKRPFISFLRSNSDGIHTSMNDRIVSLLDELGLSNRIYDNKMKLQSQIDESIDWDVIYCKIEKMRHDSINYLDFYLNNTYENINC